jgi:hypothetical protein
MSVKVLKITPSSTEIVKKLKEWNQKEASWVVSFHLPGRTYKHKYGKAEDDALKCLDHLEKFSKGTAETPFNHSQAITRCTEAYSGSGAKRMIGSIHPCTCLLPFDSCDCRPLTNISYMFTHTRRKDMVLLCPEIRVQIDRSRLFVVARASDSPYACIFTFPSTL